MPHPSARLTVLIPAYNEEQGLPPTLETLLAEDRLCEARVIVVDDGSTDNTAEIASKFDRVEVLRHKNNQGYGAGIKTGTLHAKTEFVAWFDADGQHRADDLAQMFEAAIEESYDAVIGERTNQSDVVRNRVAGKAVLRFAVNLVADTKVRDFNCGLRVYRRDLLTAYLPLLPNGFSASTTSLLLFMKRNRHLSFFPVTTDARQGKSTVKQFRDGMRTLHLMMRIVVLFSAFKAFSMLAGLLVLLGLGYGIGWAIYYGQGFPVLGAMVVLVGVLVMCVGVLSDQISALRIDMLERGAGGDWSARTK